MVVLTSVSVLLEALPQGLRDSSAVISAYCFCRRYGFSSLCLHPEAHNHLQFQFTVILSWPLWILHTCGIYTHMQVKIFTQIKSLLKKEKQKSEAEQSHPPTHTQLHTKDCMLVQMRPGNWLCWKATDCPLCVSVSSCWTFCWTFFSFPFGL